MIRQRLAGLAATLAIAALLIGLPALLLQVGFGTLPTRPQLDRPGEPAAAAPTTAPSPWP